MLVLLIIIRRRRRRQETETYQIYVVNISNFPISKHIHIKHRTYLHWNIIIKIESQPLAFDDISIFTKFPTFSICEICPNINWWYHLFLFLTLSELVNLRLNLLNFHKFNDFANLKYAILYSTTLCVWISNNFFSPSLSCFIEFIRLSIKLYILD